MFISLLGMMQLTVMFLWGRVAFGLDLFTLQLEPARVAIELDRRILKAPLWAETVLRPGAEIEIVQFVGGG